MPSTGKQFLAMLTIGSVAALTGITAQNITSSHRGLRGFGVALLGGTLGAGVGFLVVSGSGAKLVG